MSIKKWGTQLLAAGLSTLLALFLPILDASPAFAGAGIKTAGSPHRPVTITVTNGIFKMLPSSQQRSVTNSTAGESITPIFQSPWRIFGPSNIMVSKYSTDIGDTASSQTAAKTGVSIDILSAPSHDIMPAVDGEQERGDMKSLPQSTADESADMPGSSRTRHIQNRAIKIAKGILSGLRSPEALAVIRANAVDLNQMHGAGRSDSRDRGRLQKFRVNGSKRALKSPAVAGSGLEQAFHKAALNSSRIDRTRGTRLRSAAEKVLLRPIRQAAAALLLTVALISPVFAGQAVLSWDPPGGSAPAGYRIYYGTQSGHYDNVVDVGNALTYTFPNLTDGQTHFFVATAYESDGNMSPFSNEVSKAFPISGSGPPLSVNDLDATATSPASVIAASAVAGDGVVNLSGSNPIDGNVDGTLIIKRNDNLAPLRPTDGALVANIIAGSGRNWQAIDSAPRSNDVYFIYTYAAPASPSNADGGVTVAAFSSPVTATVTSAPTQTPAPTTRSDDSWGGWGCGTVKNSNGKGPLDPTLPLLASIPLLRRLLQMLRRKPLGCRSS